MLSAFNRPLPVIAFIIAALLLDQAIKYAVEIYLPMQELIPVLPFWALYRTHNLGVAFSMLSHLDAWFIVALRLVIVAFVLWLWRKTGPEQHWAHLGFSMIIAGALGNLIDRCTYGYVVDYILFYTQTWSFAVFNLADSFITLGAACIVIDEIIQHRKPKPEAD
ncbi:signal peptidase II [Rhizobium sp. AG855]|uniref:signal peptidase II n=1 Tax=Rhizobium sp. AG855 TaxID=2183898 RepID=UPI000E74C7A2|nr:signal peptidase II [Rhizobium sp. AG855]RKE86453.1 signal peptidase II [Rhizobium sp. AG855]